MTEIAHSTQQLLDELAAMPASDRLAWLRAQDSPESILLQLADVASKAAISEADQALQRTETIIQLSDASELALPRCRARRAGIRALSYNGRYNEAMRMAEESARIAEQAGIVEEMGRARLAQMHPLVESGRMREALVAGEAARDVFTRAGLDAMAARADINLGVVHQKTDAPARAVECLDRARAILKDEPLTIGHLENNRGEALLALNDFTGAEQAFSAALDAFEREGVHLTAAIAAGNLADLAVRQGRLARAMRYFERARRELKEGGSPTHLARVLAEQAEAQALLGMNDAALTQFDQALAELDRSGCSLEAARARSGMGLALMHADRLSEAETALAASAVGYEQLHHQTARAKVDLARAEIVLWHGRPREARRMALASLAVLDDRPVDAIAARHLLARIALATDHYDEACAELDAAVATARRFGVAPVLSDLLETRGLLHQARGDRVKSIADLREAVDNVERVRGSLQAMRFRTAYLGRRASLHEELVDVLLQDSGTSAIAEAFAVAERCKSRALLDRLTADGETNDQNNTIFADQTTAALHAELVRKRFDLNGLYSRLADGDLNLADEHALTTWRVNSRSLEQQIADLENRIASSAHGGAYAQAIELSDVQQALQPGQVLLEYFIVDGAITAFLVTSESVSALRDIARIEQVRTKLDQFKFQVNRALRPGAAASNRFAGMIAAAQSALKDLHELLIAPTGIDVAECDRLVIVPHGLLHAVPFHALYDGERYLVERSEIQTVPSASVFARLRQHSPQDNRTPRALVVGIDDEVAPGMVHEAHAVAAQLDHLSPASLYGDDATVRNVLEELSRVNFAHIACHGEFMSDTPSGAGLRLADRWMTTIDIASCNTSADFIVLSGCETGVSSVGRGDELTGVSSALLAAGARSVLVSLWRVDDATAVQFMHRLLESFEDGNMFEAGRKAAAVRAAQRLIIRSHPHPAHWAPFLLTGDA